MVREHIFFSGRVQGVGFRFTACYLARPMGLTGWVKNLYDGRVEMEVQGESAVIESFLTRLKNGRYICIDDMERAQIPLEKEHDFREIY